MLIFSFSQICNISESEGIYPPGKIYLRIQELVAVGFPRWRSRRDEVESFIENQKKKISERLQQRLDYENSSQFYHCGNNDCTRVTFEDALDEFFKCPSCGGVLNLKKNEKSQKAFAKQIDKMKKEMQS